MTWGAPKWLDAARHWCSWPRFGGDSGDVKDQLVGVERVAASFKAFCAVRQGRCICWGDPKCGGDIPAHVEPELYKVIESLWRTFLSSRDSRSYLGF